MRMRKFTHLKPTSLTEACSLLAQYNGKSKIIAGGTDLVVRMKEKFITPEYVIDLTYIPGLDKIEYDAKSGLKFGALAATCAAAPAISRLSRLSRQHLRKWDRGLIEKSSLSRNI